MKRKASTDFRTYSLNPIYQMTSISTTDRTSIKC